MKTKNIILLVGGIIVVGAIMFFALRNNAKAPVVGEMPVAGGTATVTIVNYQFSPSSLSVKRGTTVSWTNNDSAPHAMIGDDEGVWPGGPTIKQGETYTHTFNTVGTFTYYCIIHPGMKGSIVVTE